jgi:hypothetical protein
MAKRALTIQWALKFVPKVGASAAGAVIGFCIG